MSTVPARAAAIALTLSALGLSACGSDGTDTVTVQNTVTERTVTEVQTTTATQASPPVATTGTTGSRLSSFRSPSANIGCYMGSGSVRCDVSERDWSPPPPPASCQLDYGQGAEVSAGGSAHLVCAGDTTLNPSAPVLAYGHATQTGGLRCVSSETGMTCTATATGRGFFISRQSYRLF